MLPKMKKMFGGSPSKKGDSSHSRIAVICGMPTSGKQTLKTWLTNKLLPFLRRPIQLDIVANTDTIQRGTYALWIFVIDMNNSVDNVSCATMFDKLREGALKNVPCVIVAGKRDLKGKCDDATITSEVTQFILELEDDLPNNTKIVVMSCTQPFCRNESEENRFITHLGQWIDERTP